MTIRDLCWPRKCPVCAGLSDRPARYICSGCLMRVPILPATGCCRVCGRDVPDLSGEFLCSDCRGDRVPRFKRAASSLRFMGVGRDLTLGFKFRNWIWLRDDFADLMEASVRARLVTDSIDAVVPVPISLSHRLTRGYNQSEILAKALAKRLGLPYRNLLRRTGHPSRQSSLDEDSRRLNVIDTFCLRWPQSHAGRSYLLVDDILTTGSTLSECARILREAGAGDILCATLARTHRD